MCKFLKKYLKLSDALKEVFLIQDAIKLRYDGGTLEGDLCPKVERALKDYQVSWTL